MTEIGMQCFQQWIEQSISPSGFNFFSESDFRNFYCTTLGLKIDYGTRIIQHLKLGFHVDLDHSFNLFIIYVCEYAAATLFNSKNLGRRMNARSQTFEFSVEGRQVDEAVASIFHTVLFHRTLGKFRYKQEGSYSVGTIGYKDVDCDFIDFTYVCCSSRFLHSNLKKEISGFSEALRENEGTSSGQISLEFFQKKKSMFWATECIPWEIWNVRLQLIKITNELERQCCRERLGDLLTEKILYIAEVMNTHQYVPKMPNQSELNLIFDTTFPDVQPYLFKLSFETTASDVTEPSLGSTMKKIFRETLSL